MGFHAEDDELIYMCRKGSEVAWEMLESKYRLLIYSWIHEKVLTFKYLSMTVDDLHLAMRWSFRQAVEAYQPEFGVFLSYAKLCITRDVISYLRSEMSQQSRQQRLNYSMDEPLPDHDGMTYGELIEGSYWISNPIETIHVQETWTSIRDVLDHHLDPIEEEIFIRYQQGEDYQSLADRFHLSTKKVDNILQKIKRKMKANL